ncbi:transposase [Streptomyces violaceorubidus]
MVAGCWLLVERLLPEPGRKKVGGGPWVPVRQVLCGVLFVLHTGIRWECLPLGAGLRLGYDLLGRLAAWDEVGVCDRLHRLLLNELRSKI